MSFGFLEPIGYRVPPETSPEDISLLLCSSSVLDNRGSDPWGVAQRDLQSRLLGEQLLGLQWFASCIGILHEFWLKLGQRLGCVTIVVRQLALKGLTEKI